MFDDAFSFWVSPTSCQLSWSLFVLFGAGLVWSVIELIDRFGSKQQRHKDVRTESQIGRDAAKDGRTAEEEDAQTIAEYINDVG